MLFLHLLLFFLFGTSFVIADPGGRGGTHRVKKRPAASRVQKPRVPPYRTRFQQVLPSTTLGHQKLVFPEIRSIGRSFDGTYYRRPSNVSGTKFSVNVLSLTVSQHVLKYYANDVIDILLDGTIIPYSLPDQPGGPLMQNGFLSEEERKRLVGDWALMPSVGNYPKI